MDINQLTSIVRQLRAEKLALDYMDEVLTAVVESDNHVAQQLKVLEGLQQKTKENEVALAKFAQQLETRKKDHQAELDRLKADAEKAIAKREEEAKAQLIKSQEDARLQLSNLQSQVQATVTAYQNGLQKQRDLEQSIKALEGEVKELALAKAAAEAGVQSAQEEINKIRSRLGGL